MIRELIFQNKDEYSFKHVNFNPRKYVVMAIISTSMTINVFTLNDNLNLRTAYAEQQKIKQAELSTTAPDSSCEDMVVRTRAVCLAMSTKAVKNK